MSGAPSWMPFYPGDYIADTTHLTTEGHGAYCLLLWAAWRRGGSLVNDEKELARIVGLPLSRWRKLRAPIMAFFLISDTTLTHKRITKELEKAERLATRARENGKRGGRPKNNPVGFAGKPSGLILGSLDGTQTKARAPVLQPQRRGSSEPLPSEPNGSDVPSLDPVKALFDFGRGILIEAGATDKQARSLVGKWRSSMNDDPRLMALLVSASENHAQDPAAYVEKSIRGEKSRRTGYVPMHPGSGG